MDERMKINLHKIQMVKNSIRTLEGIIARNKYQEMEHYKRGTLEWDLPKRLRTLKERVKYLNEDYEEQWGQPYE